MLEGYRELQIQALCLVNALLGVVSKNFRLITLIREPEILVIRVVLEEHDDEDMEEINDLHVEVEAAWGGNLNMRTDVLITNKVIYLDVPCEKKIHVFKRREDSVNEGDETSRGKIHL